MKKAWMIGMLVALPLGLFLVAGSIWLAEHSLLLPACVGISGSWAAVFLLLKGFQPAFEDEPIKIDNQGTERSSQRRVTGIHIVLNAARSAERKQAEAFQSCIDVTRILTIFTYDRRHRPQHQTGGDRKLDH